MLTVAHTYELWSRAGTLLDVNKSINLVERRLSTYQSHSPILLIANTDADPIPIIHAVRVHCFQVKVHSSVASSTDIRRQDFEAWLQACLRIQEPTQTANDMLKVFLELSEWNPAIRQLVSLADRRQSPYTARQMVPHSANGACGDMKSAMIEFSRVLFPAFASTPLPQMPGTTTPWALPHGSGTSKNCPMLLPTVEHLDVSNPDEDDDKYSALRRGRAAYRHNASPYDASRPVAEHTHRRAQYGRSRSLPPRYGTMVMSYDHHTFHGTSPDKEEHNAALLEDFGKTSEHHLIYPGPMDLRQGHPSERRCLRRCQ
ncbi:hypothetical protein EKO04_000384 [Ascochyta lentis]|uniref:Uncharacterized protein n=1 Tax=Ascochyta lentis TaxID=205686 RepID=A0A8H7MLK3_9PLEO|nr:hypothetical protein EKO04_000384 [Ascochyta lentis]